MGLINDHKEDGLSPASLFLFDVTMPNGTVRRVSTHAVTYDGHAYEARVLKQAIDPMQALSPEGIEIPASVRLTLADADLALSALDRSVGWKGSRITARWLFYDFATATFSTDSIVPFVGRVDQPELHFGDGTIGLSTSYILNLQAKFVPFFPIQPRCPKFFPSTAAQKAAAANPRSIFYACGVTDPTKLDCAYTPAACAANGVPLRFGGCVYNVPPGSHSREFVSGKWLDQTSNPNAGKYGDFAAIGWGTAWVDCISFGEWPEGNSTRGEALVCEGRPARILKVVVNDVELPPANDLDGNTYIVHDVLLRYNVVSTGSRDGALNTDSPWNSAGDPHGSQCVVEWVLPQKLTGTPRIRALIEFPQVLHYQRIDTIVGGVVTFAAGVPNRDVAGNAPFTVTIVDNSNAALNDTWGLSSWSAGPPGTVTLDGTSDSGTGGYLLYYGSSNDFAWAVLDLMQRCGLADADVWIDEFVRASNYFAEPVDFVARDGTTQQHARHVCSMVVRQRRSAAELVNGMLRGCNSHLVREVATGRIGMKFRGTLAQQQPTLPDGSNYATPIAGGCVAYHFDESSMIAADGKSTLRRAARAAGSIANSVTVPFANEENDYSADSVRSVDTDDVNLMGQEITGSVKMDGVASVDRAQRLGSVYLAEQLDGEPWEWETTHKAVKLQVGQIVAVSSVDADFTLQLMRVQKIEPSTNWETARITATIHDDDWYADVVTPANDSTLPRRNRLARPAFGWSPYQVQPATGDPVYARTEWTFGLSLRYDAARNGAPRPTALLTGRVPVNEPVNLLPPVIGSQGTTASSGGTLPGDGAVYFVAVASREAGTGLPGPISKLCQVAVAQAGSTNTITVPVYFLDPDGDGYFVFAGRNPARLAATNDVGYAGSTASIDVTAIPEATWGAPDTEFDTVSIRPRLVAHYGPFAAGLSAVGAGTLEISGAGWTVNEWAGYDCSILAKGDGSELPVRNFRVTSNTADTLTVTPNPAALGVAAGDLLGMLSKPTVAGLVVTDAQWANTLSGGGTGLTAHAEKGRIARAIAGTGRGHRYVIADNTATAVTLVGPWITAWDSTTRYVIEEAAELPTIDSAGQANSDTAAVMTLEAGLENYAGRVVLFEVVMLDGGGNESAPSVNPVRMGYVAGEPGSSAGADDGYFDLTPDGSGNVQVDLANGLNQRVVLDGTTLTMLAPIFTGGAIVGGSWFALYVEQDGTGGHDAPAYDSGAGGFAADEALGQVDGRASVRTFLQFTYHAGADRWAVDAVRMGVAAS